MLGPSFRENGFDSMARRFSGAGSVRENSLSPTPVFSFMCFVYYGYATCQARERRSVFLFQHDLSIHRMILAAAPPGPILGVSARTAARLVLRKKEMRPGAKNRASSAHGGRNGCGASAFADPLIRGTCLEQRNEIDAGDRQARQNWSLHRIAAVDRNILRLAI